MPLPWVCNFQRRVKPDHRPGHKVSFQGAVQLLTPHWGGAWGDLGSAEEQCSLQLRGAALSSGPPYPKDMRLSCGLDVTPVLLSELCLYSGLLDLNTTFLNNLYLYEEMVMIYKQGRGTRQLY